MIKLSLIAIFVFFCGCVSAETQKAAEGAINWNTKIVQCNKVATSSDGKFSYHCTPHNISCDIPTTIVFIQDNTIINHNFDCFTPIGEKVMCHIQYTPSSTILTPILECEPDNSVNNRDLFNSYFILVLVIFILFVIFWRWFIGGFEDLEDQRESNIELNNIRMESK
ncbi:unnamed protein product [Caenorhabditis angaria]|uniref:Uncharacterized protein n=1 Tax=Caenorhabditis angaria TaxID=860376 RepID=A0A9P1N2A1_9PELO|nr:unnamed protein product [Caenorhabditis angaria]